MKCEDVSYFVIYQLKDKFEILCINLNTVENFN